MSKEQAILGVPGTVTIGERVFAIPAPTPQDASRVHREMTRQAQARCVNPLAAVSAVPPEALNAADRAEALRAAVGIAAGGGVQPTREAVLQQYEELDGVRFRLWYAAQKGEPTLRREDVAALVTEDNVYHVIDALDAALGYRALDPKKPLASGTN